MRGGMTLKNKTTSDETLRKKILARYTADDRTAFNNLRVGVVNGIVHLAGIVSSIKLRLVAAEIAIDVAGVRGVVNRIEAPGAPSPARMININIQQNEKESEL